MPPLFDLPKLQTLNLSNNSIRSIVNKFSPVTDTLTTLDLSQNKISASTSEDLREFLAEFKPMRQIESISILANPIMKEFPAIWVRKSVLLYN